MCGKDLVSRLIDIGHSDGASDARHKLNVTNRDCGKKKLINISGVESHCRPRYSMSVSVGVLSIAKSGLVVEFRMETRSVLR